MAPCPGELKTIRVRFQIGKRRSEVLAHEAKEFHLAAPGMLIVVPKVPPTLVLGPCTYGHPRGLNKGRGAFDVTEILQARVEESGGTFLEISNEEDLMEVSERASFEEDEHTRDECREMATDIMATSTFELTNPHGSLMLH